MYDCLNQNHYQDADGYEIVPIRSVDIENIRQWRNEQQLILRQNSIITPQQQEKYFEEQIWPSFQEEQPNQLLFSYLYHQVFIGYGGLTRIDWENKRAEISFLVEPQRVMNLPVYSQDFSHFLNLIRQVAFTGLHFHRLYTETFAFRKDHIYILEQQGFKREGILRNHVHKKNEWIDSIFHGQLKHEWQAHEK